MESIEKALNGELYPSAYPASHVSCLLYVFMYACVHVFWVFMHVCAPVHGGKDAPYRGITRLMDDLTHPTPHTVHGPR